MLMTNKEYELVLKLIRDEITKELDYREEQRQEQEGLAASKSRGKRVQQAKANTQSPN